MDAAILTILIFLSTACCCRSEWKAMPGTPYEYYHGDSRTTWHGARAQCLTQGGTWPTWSSDLWIGLNNFSNQFSWIDGSPVGSYKPWGDKEPSDDVMGKLCVYMASKKWFTSNCGLKKADVLCQRRTDNVTVTPTPPPTPTPGYCPAGYTDTGTKCYKLFYGDEAVSWDAALTVCRSQPGLRPDLASVHSYLDNAFIMAQMQTYMWVGGRRDSDSFTGWIWSDNSDTDFKPTLERNGKCIRITKPGTWKDSPWQGTECTDRAQYVCQTHKDPNNMIPTAGPTPSHPCRNGFTWRYTGCYRFSAEAVSWDKAEAACSSQDSHLVAVHTEQENAAVLLMTGGVDAWLGLKKGASGEWQWSNGEYVLYTRWKGNKAPGGGDCALQQLEWGAWTVAECEKKLPYVCKQSTGPALTTPAQVEGKCPPEGGWVPHGSYCYLFVSQHVRSWYKAMDDCLTHYYKASLVSIHNVVDNDWIYKQVQKAQADNLLLSDMFIGMHRSQKDGKLRWVDGSAVQFTHFVHGDPDQEKACAVMSKSHPSMWTEYNCDRSAGYICKAPKIPRPTRPTDGPGHCPGAEWETYGTACFLYRPDEFSRWYQAQELCLGEGGYLTSILTEHENDHVHRQMLTHTHLPTNRSYWVGASRINSTSVFGWLGGAAMTFMPWSRDYPKAAGGDCVQVDPATAVWRNADCQQRLGLVCRYDKVVLSTKGPPTKPAAGMSGGAIVGVVLGVLVAVCVMVLVGVYIVHHQRHPTPAQRFNNPLTPTVSRGTSGVDNPAGPTAVGGP